MEYALDTFIGLSIIRTLILPNIPMRINSQLSYQTGVFPDPRPGTIVSQENIRARTNDIVALSEAGAVLVGWFKGTGASGKVRAQEILDQISEKPKNGVIWTVTDYFRNNPTGNPEVNRMFLSEVFQALGIAVGVGAMKDFLKDIAMASKG